MENKFGSNVNSGEIGPLDSFTITEGIYKVQQNGANPKGVNPKREISSLSEKTFKLKPDNTKTRRQKKVTNQVWPPKTG